MPYIGVSPFNGVRKKHTYTATASQTTFSGVGAEGITLSYKDSTFVDVFQNGVKLGDADYTATSGTSIVLGTGATASDLVVIVVFDVFSVADTVSKADGGTFDGNVTMGGTLGVTGAVTANAGVAIDNITIDGTEIDLSSGNLTVDVAGAILLDADVGNVQIHDAGTEIGRFANSSSDFVIKSAISDQDMIFKGNDGGSEITALTFDMSDGGAATFAKGITLTNGNVALANGNGIDFSATADNTAQSSSMASELLDDYEEGTWTPSFSVTTTAGDLGYHSRQGSYIKIGNQVTVWFYINAYENNASGDFRVNVPFTSQNVSNYFAVASLTKTGWPSVTGDIEGRISANATIINLKIVNNANESANVTQANTDPNFYLYGTITYKTA